MNRTEDSRCLLLEQLESRCMLAGGTFAGGVLTHSSDSHERPSTNRDQPSEVRTHSKDSRSDLHSRLDSRSEQGRHDPSQRSRDEGQGRRHDRNDAKTPPLPRDTGQQVISGSNNLQLPETQTNRPSNSIVDLIDQGRPTSVPPPNTLPADGFSSNPPRSSQALTGGVPLGDRSIEAGAAEGETLASETEIPADSSQSGENEGPAETRDASQDDGGRSVSSSASGRLSVDEVNAVQAGESQGSESVIEGNEDGTLDDTGLIDSTSVTRRDLRSSLDETDGNDEAEGEWEVDLESLQRLRDVAQSSEMPSAPGFFQATDAAISSWFNQATGLIEIEAIGELQTPVDHVESIVEVVLDTAVGVRRSVDILSASSPSNDDAGGVRDAVLAAINAESMPVVANFAVVGRSVRYSAVSAPAVALLATGVTLVAKRSRRKILMQATKQPSQQSR